MPAPTIEATPGADDANSYATIEEAATYHAAHLYSTAWDDADTGQKTSALIMATRLLDQWFEWDGFTATAEQALLWPRTGVIGPNGYLEASDSIPVRVRDATAELARQLISEDRTADSDVATQGIKAVKAGSVEVEFSGSGSGSKPIPDAVIGFVGCYGNRRGRSGGAVTLQRA